MKKILLVSILLSIAAGAAFFILRKPVHYRAEDLLPPTTILLVDAVDSAGAREKFAKTALGKIWAEPDVQQFLTKPAQSLRGKAAKAREPLIVLHGLMQLFQQAKGESFFAITDVSISPDLDVEFLAGFDPGKDRAPLRAALDALISRWRVEFPSLEEEERKEGRLKYRVLREARKVKLAHAELGNMVLVSRTEIALKEAIRATRDKEYTPLSKNAAYAAQSNNRNGMDLLLYANPQAVLGKLQPLMALQSNLSNPFGGVPFQSMLGTARFLEGASEDHVWTTVDPAKLAESGLSGMKKCERRSLKAAGSNTVLYAAMSMDVNDWILRTYGEIEKKGAAIGPYQKEVDAMRQLLQAKQVRLQQDLFMNLGPELALIVEWGAETPIPTTQFLMECRDAARVEAALRALWGVLAELAPGALGTIEEATGRGGERFLVVNGMFSMVRPAIAFHEGWMVVGMDAMAIEAALKTWNGAGPHLADSASFKGLESRFGSDYSQFIYCEQKQLFEKAYNLLSGLALLAGSMTPKVSQNVDLTRLPQTATIARHLGPSLNVVRVEGNQAHQSSYGPVNANVMTLFEILLGLALLAQMEGQTPSSP